MTGTGPAPPDGPLVCVVGATATGKTDLAIDLARRFNGEIVNADSRQVYREMSIGTAKPTPSQQALAPHHLVDLLDPSESFGLGLFLKHAADALLAIRALGKLPIVCGGTGHYIWGLVEGQNIPAVPPDPQFRAELESEAARTGHDALHRRLAEVDPPRAAAIDPRNVRRVIRALEIHRATGRRPSELGSTKGVSSPHALVLGLGMPRDLLYRRIDERVDGMMQGGLLEEVESLSTAGYTLGEGPLDSPGYRELGQYLAGTLTLQDAVERTKTQTHRMARRQHAWFRPSDPRIHWLCATDPHLNDRAGEAVSDFLASRPPVLQ